MQEYKRSHADAISEDFASLEFTVLRRWLQDADLQDVNLLRNPITWIHDRFEVIDSYLGSSASYKWFARFHGALAHN